MTERRWAVWRVLLGNGEWSLWQLADNMRSAASTAEVVEVMPVEVTEDMVRRAAEALKFDSKLSYEGTAHAVLTAALGVKADG